MIPQMIKPYSSDRGPRHMCWVLGPKAASDPDLRQAADRLRRAGHTLDVRLTWEGGDGRRWAEDAVENGAEVVVAGGGDGTLNEVVNGVFGADIAVGLLPYGTANDFAQSARILAGNPAAALEHITHSRPQAIDVIEVKELREPNREYLAVNMITGGWWTQVTAEASPLSKQLLGGSAYFLEGLSRLTELESTEIVARGPDFSWSGRALSFAIGNGRHAGGSIRLCPQALLNDGAFDVMILPAQEPQNWLPLLGDALVSGDLSELSPVVYRQLPWLEISCPDGAALNLDGQPVRGHHFRFTNLARRLKFFLGGTDLLTDLGERS